MAWDITQPTDTTKIRNLGIVIRPNWVAIQNADATFKPAALNFNDRTVAGLAVNPTAIADAFIMYCKTDTAGNSELFGINENSAVIQFTKGAPTNAQNGTSYLPGGIIIKWGIFSMGAGVTTADVNFVGVFPGAVYSIVLTSTTANPLNGAGVDLSQTNLTKFRAYRAASPASNQSYFYMATGN